MNITIKSVAFTSDNQNNLRGVASICFDDSFVVKGFKIMVNSDGELFVSPPSYFSEKDQEFKNIAFFPNADERKKVYDAIIQSYGDQLKSNLSIDLKPGEAPESYPDTSSSNVTGNDSAIENVEMASFTGYDEV